MIILRGTAASGGYMRGIVKYHSGKKNAVAKKTICDTDREIKRFRAARDGAVAQLGELQEKALASSGSEAAEIFGIHSMMLEDEDYCDCVVGTIAGECVNAEYAVSVASVQFSEMLASTGDEYIAGRAADVKDVSERVIAILSGTGDSAPVLSAPAILAASDLAPSETVQIDRKKLLAIVTSGGTKNSHTAILARSMDIPAVVAAGPGLDESCDGKEAIVDGCSGLVYIDPDPETVRLMDVKAAEYRESRNAFLCLKGMENLTKKGRLLSVFANCGNLADIDSVLDSDAGGIGLLRSEFLYLGRSDFPAEEELFGMYRTVAERMHGKKVIIRTIDIGADKQASCFNLPAEENPALGMRAIRVCLARPDAFRTQLRAILRASAYGNVAIMFPMIISPVELARVREILDGVKASLDAERVAYDHAMETGIMVETPAAAILSDELAKQADFFSIGSNDLTQYTLAIDRQNPALQAYADGQHEAVMRLVEMTVKNAHAAGIWAGICGELGADLSLTDRFLAMGMDEFSVQPSAVLPLRKKIREYEGD